ncbi:hypothetical protein D3C72_555810 [compost metagenome]
MFGEDHPALIRRVGDIGGQRLVRIEIPQAVAARGQWRDLVQYQRAFQFVAGRSIQRMDFQALFASGTHQCQIGKWRVLLMAQRTVDGFKMFFDVFPGFSLVHFFQLRLEDIRCQVFHVKSLEATFNEGVQMIDQQLFAGDRTGLGADHQILPFDRVTGDQLCK